MSQVSIAKMEVNPASLSEEGEHHVCASQA